MNLRSKFQAKTCCSNILRQHVAQLFAALETCCQQVAEQAET